MSKWKVGDIIRHKQPAVFVYQCKLFLKNSVFLVFRKHPNARLLTKVSYTLLLLSSGLNTKKSIICLKIVNYEIGKFEKI
jgi:hypothetical protein